MASRSGRPSAAEPVPCGRNARVIGKAVKINNLQTDAVHGDLGSPQLCRKKAMKLPQCVGVVFSISARRVGSRAKVIGLLRLGGRELGNDTQRKTAQAKSSSVRE